MSEKASETKKRSRVDFTTGTPWTKLIIFALPLMLSSLLQQMYNTVAKVIVGRGVSYIGLAAVGLAGPYLRVLTSAFMGLSMGGNVMIAQYYGAKDSEGLRCTMHTGLVVFGTAGLVMSALGIAIAPLILQLTGAPDDVYPMALTYMRILFSGIAFQLIYNMFAGFSRGMGDSRAQMYILGVTSVVNASLCWIFVIYMQWGVAGAAMATVTSQCLSAILMIVRVQQNEYARLSIKDLKLTMSYAKELIRIGLPTAIQQVAMSLAGPIVMGYITSYGTETIAGYSVGTTIDMYVAMPVSALNMTASPYTAQNVGAGKMDRVDEGAKQMVMINSAINIVVAIVVLSFMRPLLGMFTDNPGTIAAGMIMLRIMVPTHIMTAINQPLSGVIRGSGNTFQPMVNALMMVIGIRIPVIILLNQVFNSVEVVYYSQVIANLVGLVHILYIFYKGKWRANTIAKIAAAYPKGIAEEAV
ncbi:MAG: MATE family efflux transporter [Clostridiales bacterium]|nr:MATE family efflux transporter [Clostridiales bacterium]